MSAKVNNNKTWINAWRKEERIAKKNSNNLQKLFFHINHLHLRPLRWVTLLQSVRWINPVNEKYKNPNRSAVDEALTRQVLSVCLSIHSLTRKVSYCQGTDGLWGEGKEKEVQLKVNQISSFKPAGVKKWRWATRGSSELSMSVGCNQSAPPLGRTSTDKPERK